MMMIKYEIGNIFPTPLYRVHGKTEKFRFLITKEIEDVIKDLEYQTSKPEALPPPEFPRANVNDRLDGQVQIYHISENKWILEDNKFKKIRSFCEEHIDNYVEKVIGPADGYDFCITQSWLNITKPGQEHGRHHHENTTISGIFYIKNASHCPINFYNKIHTKHDLSMNLKTATPYNTVVASTAVKDGDLLLFPGWLDHSVDKNNHTTDRISLAFNVFAKGIYGKESELNQVHIK